MSLLQISGLLDEDDLAELRSRLPTLRWEDGRATAGRTARRVKRNEQAELSKGEGRKLRAKLEEAVASHAVVKAAARPRRLSRAMISRTSGEGHYGLHVDNAIMGMGAERLRTDLSYTLFLTPPEEYEGGELIIHTAMGSQNIKLDAGDLVLYPSSEIHEVAPVTAGERIVCVGWIESQIADPARRALLFDLENLRVSLRRSLPPDAIELLTLDKTIANLLRMWATV